MTVYIDIVLIENIFMNYIILFATATINKVELKLIRIFLASLLGGIYAVASYISELEAYKTLTLKILLSIAMVYIALRPESIKKCLKQLLIFYLTSFTFGRNGFCTIILHKTIRNINEKWNTNRVISIKNSYIRRNNRICYISSCI